MCLKIGEEKQNNIKRNFQVVHKMKLTSLAT